MCPNSSTASRHAALPQMLVHPPPLVGGQLAVDQRGQDLPLDMPQ